MVSKLGSTGKKPTATPVKKATRQPARKAAASRAGERRAIGTQALAADMLRNVRTRGEALSAKINELLARLE